ncbi:MAG TPA: hypothetical protein ENL15_02790 [Firmicutes bacterium]|nr:hypothetical protein [Bacillota bacterium]
MRMIQGRNSDVDFKNRKVHVQTEYMPSNSTIVTLIFDNGAIIGSKKKKLIISGTPEKIEKKIEEKLVEQHKEVMLTIKNAEKDELVQVVPSDNSEDLMNDFLKEVFGVGDE